MSYELESSYRPRGDQAQAIAKLLKSVEAGNRHQTLLGVTGSGKTFTIANVIRALDRPTLIISHNKTLAAQLYSEFKQFFPHNAVEYFVSYFDYYQPEAYIPRSDTYIEKDSSINEEIERLRLSATSALLSRRDTIVVASVSCIYGVTSPEDYLRMLLTVKRGQQISSRSRSRAARGHALRAQRREFRHGENSGCAATWSRSIPRPRMKRRCAWNFSAMRSTRSRASTRSPATPTIVRRDHLFSGETIRHACRQIESRAHLDPRPSSTSGSFSSNRRGNCSRRNA